MRVVFTGGFTGGHFYPIIAVAQKLHKLLEREKIANVEFFYMSVDPYNADLLAENSITYKHVTAGKLRTYSSIQNFFDIFKTAYGVIKAVFQMFLIYPDVVFSKGGFASFPVLMAARFFRIPVIIHESDSAPGRVSAWSGKFAQKVALSYADAAQYFPLGRTALTGNPIREDLARPTGLDAFKELGLEPDVPVILVLGGSQGAQKINDQLVTLAPRLIEKYQVIHQAGVANEQEVKTLVEGLIAQSTHKSRYHVYGYLDTKTMKLAGEAATLIISRSGSTIFEIATWGVPAILIPIANSNADHQRKNAFSYARAGCAEVIEEANLVPSILFSEIENLLTDTEKYARMKNATKDFSKLDAAEKIAEQIVAVLLRHQTKS